MRKYALYILLASVPLFCLIALLAWEARFTVASGTMWDDLGYFSYHYSIQQTYFRNSFRLRLWTSRGMEFTHEELQLTVEEVLDQRWINNGAAIYLNLRVKSHESMPSESSIKVIFDFHRGEIYTNSRYTLWRNFDKRHDSKDWMSEAEFDAILQRLDQ